MNTDIEKLVNDLSALNQNNVIADSFLSLDTSAYPKDMQRLIQTINQTILIGDTRRKDEHNQLETINNIIGSGMWSMEFDTSGKMTRVTWTPTFRYMLGFHDVTDFPDELESWSDRLHPEDKPDTMEAYWDAVAGRRIYDVVYRLMNKAGEYKWFRAKGEVRRRADGTPHLFVGTFIDYSQQKENEILQQENQKTQEALSRTKNALQNINAVLTSLCSDYLSVYRVNCKTDTYEVFKVTDRLRGEVAKIAFAQHTYSETILSYCQNYVLTEDQEYFLKMTSLEHVIEVLKTRKNYSLRYRVRENPDGMVYFEISFGASEDDHVVVGFRNIDSVIQKEESYRMESQHDIEETLEGARTGIWSIEMEDGCEPRMYADRTMRMLIASPQDASPEEHYVNWYSRIDPDYYDTVQKGVDEMVQNGRGEVSYPWHHPVNGRIYVRCGGVIDTHFDKPGIRIKGYHQDITETIEFRKHQEQKIMDALMEARRANQVKSEFLSHMSHDIRTPINGILGMLAIAEKNPDDLQKQRECRDKIRIASEHLLSLINDVLDISKLESGSFNLEKEPFEMMKVLESCHNILVPQAEDLGVLLEMDEGHIAHPYLVGSALHLRQILINIISNGIKYNRSGGKVYVHTEEVSADKENALFRFEIRDTGIGMSQKYLEHLYEPFTQENSDARTNYKGTGLGMAITKKLVEQMNGRIEVESEPGKGTRFILEIPLEISAAEVPADEAAEPEMSCDISGMCVLLAEDNETNREIAEYMLRDAGADVINAENGREALQLFTQSVPGSFDCILMDIMMPVMDGLTAAKEIRASGHPDSKTVPIIALSANVFEDDIAKSREAGMNDHLAKPMDIKKLLTTIAAYRK